MSLRRRLLPALFSTATLAWSVSASAHISLDRGTTHASRYGDDELKDAPCGRANGARGTNVYTYAPGETIEVHIVEFIPHPGYFRIAFDDDGDDGFVDPVSIKPVDPARPCPFNEFDQCGTTDDFQDFYNSPEVLMDNLDPHASAPLNQEYRWQVTLPNVQCDNCTLQIIQVMEDVIHGGYNTDKSLEPVGYVDDVYHQCIDIVLEGPLQPGSGGSAGTGGSATGGSAGGAETAGGAGDAFDDTGSGSSCSVAPTAGPRDHASLWLLVLGTMALRRRRPGRR